MLPFIESIKTNHIGIKSAEQVAYSRKKRRMSLVRGISPADVAGIPPDEFKFIG